jgi:hypothetical protein
MNWKAQRPGKLPSVRSFTKSHQEKPSPVERDKVVHFHMRAIDRTQAMEVLHCKAQATIAGIPTHHEEDSVPYASTGPALKREEGEALAPPDLTCVHASIR